MNSNSIVAAVEEAFARARNMEAPLNEQLQVVADAVRALNPTFAEAVDRFVMRLQETGAGNGAPEIGDQMPPFLLPDEMGRLVDLEEVIGRGPVAVAFHRGHWCPYCRLNTIALTRVHQETEAAGAQLLAITPDRQKFSALLKAEANAPFPILTDMDNGYSLSLNLAIWVGEEVKRMTGDAGWDIPAYQGNDSWMLPIPATFVVGTDGLIKARHIDPDYRKRKEVEDLLDALRTAH